MHHKTFLHKSHFKIYDSIVPIFRLLCIITLLGFMSSQNEFGHYQQSFSFIFLYSIYAVLLLVSPQIREVIVLKYPFLIGIFETLIVSYGIMRTGGSSSPFYFSYILMIAFFGMAHNLKYSLIVSGFCASCFGVILATLGEKITIDTTVKLLFLFAFAIFTGLINERINKYNIRLAVYDQLTTLYNRQYFYGAFEHLLIHSSESNLPISLVVMDVDAFKAINDQYGHLHGDQILAEIGNLIKHSIQKGDIAARFGGDEFVILLPKTDKRKAESFSRQLQKSIGEQLSDGVTVSIGFAVYPEDGKTADVLFHTADMAMYQNKRCESEGDT